MVEARALPKSASMHTLEDIGTQDADVIEILAQAHCVERLSLGSLTLVRLTEEGLAQLRLVYAFE
eukprot:4927561-Amphidinium_carterae.2